MMVGIQGSVQCSNCTFQDNFALESGVFEMNNAGTSLFTGSRFVNNIAINAPIGTTTTSTVVFNDTLIQKNLAISAVEYYTEAFECVSFCYLAMEFKEQTLQIINETTLASSKAEIRNQQSTVMFDNNTLITE